LPRIIIFDTNFLLIPLHFGIDIFEESKNAVNQKVVFAVTPQILDEINKLKTKAKASFMKELMFAEKIIEQCLTLDEEIHEGELVDDSLVRIAEANDCIVATTDVKLRKKLHQNNVDVLIMRQKSYLELIGSSN
jgi:rRNA-processing protein FCF1